MRFTSLQTKIDFMFGKRISLFNLIIIFLGGLAILFIMSPIVGFYLHTSAAVLYETGNDREVQASIGRTLLISFSGTLFFSLLAIPLAYVLARKNFTGKRLVSGIIDLPVIIPHSAAGIAILGFISRDTVIGQIADYFGLNLVGNPIGIAFAMSFVSVPFLINAARDGFMTVPVRLEKAALTLGASPLRMFFTISLPLAWRSILSGFVLMFGRGMSEFGAVVIVAYHPMIVPVLIWERFTSFGLSYARPVSALFILICLLFFIGLRYITIEKKKPHAQGSKYQ
jgi:molybdate/tungstate transport system permease protein